jgi:predicted nucleic acid-binding protein
MFLLDTNVVSELRKITSGKADGNVTNWARGVKPSDFYISVITVHELEVGVRLANRRDPRQGAALRLWLEEQILMGFNGRILPVDTAIALRSASLHVPDPHPIKDGLIAATALVHGMTVVTRNVADFAGTGVPVFDPWTAV